MDNMAIYNKVSAVPEEAKKKITGGKLNGMTDINPIWRIRTLTELFGPCGIGWKLSNPKYWTEPGANGEILAYCEMELSYKVDGEWSAPITGIGGSKSVTKNQNGLQSSDEAYKMAYTDAISVCCKMLGVGASVYWESGETKYRKLEDQEDPETQQAPPNTPKEAKKVATPPPQIVRCHDCNEPIKDVDWGNGKKTTAHKMVEQTISKCGVPLCGKCYTLRAAIQENHGNQGR